MNVDRKFEHNFAAYLDGLEADGIKLTGDEIGLLTLTPPGADVLPWACLEGAHEGRCSPEQGCRVAWPYNTVYEGTVQARASRLFEAAQRYADRKLRRHGYTGQLPRQLGNVRAPQKRGVSHFHYGMPKGRPEERFWSREVERYMNTVRKWVERHYTADERWAILELEYLHGEVTAGVYGFGFVHPGRKGSGAGDAARYMARNAASYIGGQGARHYVSSRLTAATGITMRTLRATNLLYVRRRDGVTPLVPEWWSESFRASVLPVWALVDAARAP